MVNTLTTAQMRALEQEAIASGRVTGLELMERAGASVVEAVFEEWPELAKGAHRAVVLCGPGNNGGDGFVVARLLAEAGWGVEVFATETRAPDAMNNRRRYGETNAIHKLTKGNIYASTDADLYVDAVFGTGLGRPIEGDLGNLMRYLSGYGGDRAFFEPRLVAVDLPSGLDSDTGEVLGASPEEWAPTCPFCRLTVAFHRKKFAHVLGRGPDHCGKVVVKDIGL